MRRFATFLFVVIAQLVFMASGQQVAYSEAVPAAMLATKESATVVDRSVSGQTSSTVNQAATVVTASRPATATTPIIKGDTLTIPSLGFAAPIVNVGVTSTNNIDVPAGLQVGRWVGGAQPGTPGAVFLDGHVDGVFARLSGVAVGQTVRVSFSGRTYTYQVVHKETVPLDGIDMRRALSVYGGASEGLNMMTCAGTFIPSMDTYDQRLIVYAVRI